MRWALFYEVDVMKVTRQYLTKITFIEHTHLARPYQYCGCTIPERKH